MYNLGQMSETTELQVLTDRIEPDITLVTMAGKIVMGPDSLGLENLVADLVRKDVKKVIFDLTRVYYLDSSGLGALAHCFVLLQRAKGGLRLAGVSERVRSLLRTTRLEAVIPCFPAVDDARQNFTVDHQAGHTAGSS